MMPSPPGAAAAVAPPATAGAAIGEAGVVAVVAVGAELDELSSAGCSIFIVRGTWKASRPSRITPPTAAKIFCRLAFALGSIFFAIRFPTGSRLRQPAEAEPAASQVLRRPRRWHPSRPLRPSRRRRGRRSARYRVRSEERRVGKGGGD